ncbi:MAG: ABC transporter permease [Leptospira sp.]|nr:ABC transporter permease [Leptospira sp.]
MNRKAFFRTFFRRELFSRKTYSFQVILSVMIGVGAVSGIQSYKTSLTDLIRVEAKNLMGADLAFQTPEKFRKFQNELMEDTLPKDHKKAEVIQFLSMISNPINEEVSLSLVRGMDAGYPFYGELKTDPASAYANLAENDIILEENLAKNLELSPGMTVQLGEKSYIFRGILLKEPGAVGGFTSMAPTSIVKRSSLIGSGLEDRGSRIRYSMFVKLPNEVDSFLFKEKHFEKYSDNDMTIFHNTEVNSGSQLFITNTLDFLSLLGLASFFLGAIAIFISTRTRVIDSQKQISILKCLGLNSQYIRFLVISETLILSIIGSILGLFLGNWLQSGLPNLLIGGEDGLGQGLTGVALVEGIGLGIVVPILVSIHSLVKAGSISPLVALKNPEGVASDKSDLNRTIGKIEYILLGFVFLLFWFIAYLDTGSILKGLVLCAVFFILPTLIWIMYLLLRSIILYIGKKRELPRVTSLVMKKFTRQYGLISLSVIGLGSAIFVLVLSLILRESLLNLGGARQITKRPNVFILDIRNEQQAGFKELVNGYKVEEFRAVPALRGRLASINGEAIDRSNIEKDATKRDWRASARVREYMLSYRDELFDTETVTSGKFWKPGAENEISVEKDFSKYLGAGIGDELEFRMEGFPMDRIKGKITNLRSVNWSDMKPNFVVLFSGGDLEKLPGFYISSLYMESSQDRFRLQKELVKKYPNITFIDTEKAVKSFEGIVDKVSSIINVMSSLLVFASVLLLVSVLYSSSRDRLRELIFFRVVGARQRLIQSIVLQEAAFLAIFSFSSSFILALISDIILNRFVLDLESIYPWQNIAIVFVAVFIGVSFAYYITTRKLFDQPVKKLMKLV